MKKNIGSADRLVRVLLAFAVAGLYLTGQISGTVAIILGLFAFIFLLTGALARCPLYVPFKISTTNKNVA